MTTRTLPAALDSLPHAHPFRFVTEVSALRPGESAHGAWVVCGDEDFFRGHFPGDPLVPGALIGEALAQLSGVAVFGGGGAPATPARLAHLDIKLLAPVRPPARIELSATLTRAMSGLYLFDVGASVGGAPVASGRVVLASAPE